VSLSAGDRVLVKNQSTGSANGIYVVASGSWSRASDANSDAEVTPNLFVFVEEGTANADSGWTLQTNGPITLGSSSLSFVQFSGAGQITAGDGLTKTGNTINAAGTADRISVSADAIDIAGTYVGQNTITTLGTISGGTWQGTAVAVAYGGTGALNATDARANLGAVGKYATSIGNNSDTAITVTHSLGSKDVIVQVYDNSSPFAQVWPDIEHTNTTSVTLQFAVAPTTNQYRVVVTG
jgi:phage-related tail fiber protein